MKKLFTLFAGLLGLVGFIRVHAQCTSSVLNWDQRDYYYISGSRVAPYGHNSGGFPTPPIGGYINDLQETVQRFAIGRTGVTFTTSAVGMVKGENTSHTGDQAGFGGADAQFTPSANNQTVTLSFDKEVSNVAFVLYDIDGGQRINFAARNAANGLIAVNLTPNNNTNTPVSGNGGTAAYVTSISTNAASNTNNATVRVNITGSVKQITLTIPTIGSDPSFWLSRVNACVPDGNFPMNYYQVPELEPIAGQPPYFLVTPDNQSAYMIDTLGRAKHLFTDAQYGTNGYINSFAYDHVHRLLYYVTEKKDPDSTVKTLKRYNFNTNVIQIIGDVENLLGIPTFDQGIQSGAAAFYDGALYLGIEGGRHTTTTGSPDPSTTRESIIYRVSISDTSVSAFSSYRGYQVWAIPAYTGTNVDNARTFHDWGDFLIKDGILIDFNTARENSGSNYSYQNSAFHHVNLTTGDTVQYTNPAGTTANAIYSGQAGLDYYGNLWAVRNNLVRYDGNGKLGQAKVITVVSGPAWVGSAGDASEPFRPKMDFGDAPFVYEGSNRNQAAHEFKANLRIGSTLDLEWVKEPSANAYVNADADGADEDGLRYVTLLTTSTNYLTEVDVFNNTGTVATVVAWLDFNKNNVFDPAEGIVQDVPSSASMQRLNLFWQGLSNTLQDGSVTYLRIRITSKANNMGVNNATGYFPDGEVEDYLVTVDKTVLSSAAAKLSLEREEPQSVRLQWTINGSRNWYRFVVERSSDRKNWSSIGAVAANEALAATSKQYSFTDGQPGTGKVTYRLLMQDVSGKYEYSEIKSIDLADIDGAMHLTPNPAKDEAVLSLKYYQSTGAIVTIHQLNGSVISKQQVALNKGWNRIALDGISGLKPGMYMVKLQTSTDVKQMKLIKQ